MFYPFTQKKISTSEISIGYIINGNLLLEKPGAVRLFHVVRTDPSYSPMNIILLSAAFLFIPVHSLVLLYCIIRAADTTYSGIPRSQPEPLGGLHECVGAWSGGGWSGATPSISTILPVQSVCMGPPFAPPLLSGGAMV